MSEPLNLKPYDYQKLADEMRAKAARSAAIEQAFDGLGRWPNIATVSVTMAVPGNKAGPVIEKWIADNWPRLRQELMNDLRSEADDLRTYFGDQPND